MLNVKIIKAVKGLFFQSANVNAFIFPESFFATLR